MSGWYYKHEKGEVVGPLSGDEIKHCAARGGLTLDSPVMHVARTKGKWIPAGQVLGLRRRLEAIAQERSKSVAAARSKVIKGYVPPRRSWASRLRVVKRPLTRMTERLVRACFLIADFISAKTAEYVCTKCEGKFVAFRVPGQCPLCGEWEKIACGSCRLTSGAQRFVENKYKCPRCGAKVPVPGVQSSTWRTAGLVGLLLLVVALTVARVLAS